MKRLALAAVAVVALSYDIEATESKPTTELKIVNESSFMVADYHRIHPEVWIWKKSEEKWCSGVDNYYEEYGKEHNVDIKTLRGENFQPREFWSQPFKEILHTLYPVLKHHEIERIIEHCCDVCMCCLSPYNPKYCFSDYASRDLPEVVELLFEEDAFKAINKWMKNKGLKPIDWGDYQESLHDYYTSEPKTKYIKEAKINARRLPLFEYFLPYFTT